MRSSFETSHFGISRGTRGEIVGRDGRTAYELHAGKPYRRQLVNLENECTSCRFDLEVATALLSPFFLDFLLGCSSTWRCA